jgi:hypothetical protein
VNDKPQAIACSQDTKIYIFCPAGNATGGPEALHQLSYHLNELGFNAFMFYYVTPDSQGLVHDDYKKYQQPYVTELENKRDHIMILPETYLFPIFKRKFNLIRKVIWWLSVVNYYKTQKPGINSGKPKRFLGAFWKRKTASFAILKQTGVLSIAHSYYSLAHLRENGIDPVGQISDYMNDTFFEFARPETKKEDIIIYNPKKNDEFLQEIISLTQGLKWIPLVNMTPQEVAGWMNRAKLYVDFGYHPGKERMPREACIMKCCMIIGKTGSASYHQDMPIPEKYRFGKSEDQLPHIVDRIKYCLTNYDTIIDDIAVYRRALYHEKEDFIDNIKKVFVKI